MILSFTAALLLRQALQPNFVQPIESAPVLMIHADMNGHDALLGVDTGSYNLIVKPTAPKGGDDAAASKVTLKFLSPDPLDAHVTSFPTPADAVVGLQYLKDKAIGIDARKGALSVWNAGNLSQDQVNFWFSHAPAQGTWTSTPADAYQTVELETVEGDPHYFVEGSVNGTALKLGLDTDAATSAIEENLIQPAGFVPFYEGQFGGLKGGWPVHIGFVDALSFGGQDLKAYPLSEVAAGTLKPAQGIIGFDALMNRRALIDFPAHKLYLGSLNPSPAGSDALVPLGIRLAPFVGGKQFIGVIPSSPAAQAGLHSGDELISLDDKPVGILNLPLTHSSLAVDYAKAGLPKSLKVVVKSKDGTTSTREIKQA
jgi:hypothetical protein